MVVMDFDGIPSSSAENPWVADGLQAVRLIFVRKFEEIADEPQFDPEYVYQHFGESENIFGYKDLTVKVVYSEVTMRIYPIINFSQEISSVDRTMKADDIIEKLRCQLPAEQMTAMVELEGEFRTILAKEDQFSPMGELIGKFEKGEEMMEVYRVDEASAEFDAYLARLQSLSLWYINACEYTDNSDPKWMHYLLFRSTAREDGVAGRLYTLAGYASFYRFYAYPEHERPRLAQILLLPAFRRSGQGASFLQCIYADLCARKEVIDITVEDPADNCILLRDYVDCVNCMAMPEFTAALLKRGFTNEMYVAARKKWKLNKRQCRRVYEILRMRVTDKKNENEVREFRLDVKKRLEGPMRKSERDWKKLTAALNAQELSQVAASQLSADEKMRQLAAMYEAETEAYSMVIQRLQLFPRIH